MRRRMFDLYWKYLAHLVLIDWARSESSQVIFPDSFENCTSQVTELLAKGREELEVVKRQAALSTMFKPNMDYVINKQPKAWTSSGFACD